MARPRTAPTPSTAQLRRVHPWLEKPLQPGPRRRAEVLLLYAPGRPASTIALLLQVHANTGSADLHAFARHGWSFLSRPRTIGAPPRRFPEQIAPIWRLAQQAPTTLGLPFGRGTVAKLRADLIQQRIVKNLRREHRRRVLKQGGTACAVGGASSSPPIPTGA